MKVIKQKDRFSCVACVACMATGTRLCDFRRFVHGKEPPYSDRDLYRYLVKHDMAMGVGFEDVNSGGKFSASDHISIELALTDFPAYVVVKSMRFRGVPHAIYWDGKEVFDPNPGVEGNGLPLEEYTILQWFPIVEIKKRGG